LSKEISDADFITGLIGVSGPHSGKKFEIIGSLTTIGGEYADINLSQDKSVSPQHCYITQEAGEFWIYNAEGSKGTLFSGRPIKRAKLRDGDKITIGKTSFVWHDKSGAGKSQRNIKDIEFIAVAPVDKPSTGRAQADSRYIQKSSSASIPKTDPRTKIFWYIVAAIILILSGNAYFIVPAMETSNIERHLNQYWDDYNSIMNNKIASLNLSALRVETDDFDYTSIESIPLTSTLFTSIGRPHAARMKNLHRIEVIMLSTDIMNILRHEDIPVEQYKAIYNPVADLKAIDLTQDDEWALKRDWFLARFVSIQDQLKINAVSSPLDYIPEEPSPELKDALDDFLSGYYIYDENRGLMSKDLSAKAFKYFDASREKYRSILRSDSNNKQATVIIILCDYLMVDIRMKANIDWDRKHIASSIDFLKEGYKMLDGISGRDYENNFPHAVNSTKFSKFSNFRAQYNILIDQFEKKTNTKVGVR
jgi:hypothetical protein